MVELENKLKKCQKVILTGNTVQCIQENILTQVYYL